MSSIVLHDKIFFSRFILINLFFIVPRVFDSTCFLQNLQPDLDKLEPRTIKCVFVGYSRT